MSFDNFKKLLSLDEITDFFSVVHGRIQYKYTEFQEIHSYFIVTKIDRTSGPYRVTDLKCIGSYLKEKSFFIICGKWEKAKTNYPPIQKNQIAVYLLTHLFILEKEATFALKVKFSIGFIHAQTRRNNSL